MKRTRKLSFLMALIIAVTNVVCIAMPSAGAQESDFIVSDDFETGYTAISTNAAATLESMQELCDMNPWWYSAKPTVFNKAADVTEKTPLIASVVGADGNNLLRITYHAEAGIGTNITTPLQANTYAYESGSYEVGFKLYTTGNVQVYGVGGKMVDGTATYYKHNILTKAGNVTYMGDTEASSPSGVGGTGIGSNTWYTFKVVVNNDLGYYSVEVMDKNGTPIQRVGGINFKDGCPAISNIRFQAQTEGSVVYIDDYSSKQVNPENLLYEDDFNLYSGFSGAATSYTVGANMFKEVSQMRVQDKNSQFVLGSDESNATDKHLQLKASKYSGSVYYPANAMYMPWNGYILTKDSQNTRGKLMMSFSFCVDNATAPSGTSASFRVICADNFNGSNITNLESDNYTMFRVQPFLAGGIVYGVQNKTTDNDAISSYQQIYKGKWYDVQMTFDLVNDKVSTIMAESGTTAKLTFERSTGLYNGGTALNSIKSIMFKADEGMVIDIDDFKLKYVMDAPQVNKDGVEVVDFNGEKVLAGATGVNPALETIKIPFTSPISDESLNNITLKAENSEEAFDGYSSKNANGVYTMNFNKTLAPNTKYILTVPTTVTSVAGVALAEAYTYEFTTGDGSDEAEMGIVAVSVDSIDKITNGGQIQVRTKYANTTETAGDCLMIIAYYDENNTLLTSSHVKGNLSANSVDMNYIAGFTVPDAETLNMSDVSKVSIYLWDSYKNIRPYCAQKDIL